jgi:urea transport system substrate-binding protein
VIGRITADARIVPIWICQGLIAPEPWSPWLERYDSEPRTAPRRAREPALAS